MNDLVREGPRVLWCLAAAATLVAALRVWWPVRVAARLAARGDDPRLRAWAAGQSHLLGELVVVGALNLAAGLYSYALPVRPDARLPPHSPADWAPLVLPLLFVGSAVTKFAMVVTMRRAYRRVVDPP